jgi:hypothetical protein
MRHQRFILLFALLLLVVPFAVYNAQTTPSPDADTAAAELGGIPWLALDRAEIGENDEGDPVFMVYYISNEFDMVAYRAEMLEVFRQVGTLSVALPATVTLIPVADMGFGLEGIEAATIDTATLQDFAKGDMTRTAFLEQLDIEPLEHGSSDSDRRPA